MVKFRPRVPKGLLIAIAILLILGLISNPIIRSLATPEQLAQNVLLNAIPFILIFAAIILAFIAVISLVADALNNKISQRLYKVIERLLIGGIILGIFGMLQPWLHLAYKYGFLLLLFSTLGFILWSHVTPKRETRGGEIEKVSIGKYGESTSEGGD
jgi:Na+-driven multidrug efflux pump